MHQKSSLGIFVVIWGGFWRCVIFDKLSIGKTLTKNQKMGAKVFQKAQFSVECAGLAGDYKGFKNLKNWKEFGMRLGFEFVLRHAVFPHEGGSGLY